MMARSCRHVGFTLIELLVVITIIAVLAGLLMPVLGWAQHLARATVTKQRMTAILNALSVYGTEDGSRCLALQDHLALGGAGRFASLDSIRSVVIAGGAGRNQPTDLVASTGRRDVLTGVNYDNQAHHRHSQRRTTFDVVPPQEGPVAAAWYIASWPMQWPETDWDLDPPGIRPPILRFPWGKPGLRRDGIPADPARLPSDVIATPNYPVTNVWVGFGNAPADARIWTYEVTDTARSSPVRNGYEAMRSDGTELTGIQGNVPMPFDVGWMSPQRSIALMQAAGVLPAGDSGPEAFRSDRSPGREWNDRWGRPLIVSYALFIPERIHSTVNSDFTVNNRDRFLKTSLEHYRFNRACYLVVGAAGPAPLPAAIPTSWEEAQDPVVLRDLWKEVRQRAKAVDWNENSFTDPPWEGVREYRPSGRGSAAFLTAPVEIK